MYEGGCLCGQIRYRTTGKPDWPHLCSCPHCQKLGGCPVMAWVDFANDTFEWTGPGGEPHWYATFPTTRRGFCPTCGSTVAALDDDAEMMGVTLMSLDDHTSLVPEHQSFKDHAVRWLPVLATTDE
ncbi:GFA family protein [Nocardia sp. BMG51109]|uniref:GFA family protein n=1 Tax=Nocardia sp. BMG51109 TaxID=1056816 RepID=UPI0004630C2E|nr:GFA family protein [Nocardia sp. BMG51109]